MVKVLKSDKKHRERTEVLLDKLSELKREVAAIEARYNMNSDYTGIFEDAISRLTAIKVQRETDSLEDDTFENDSIENGTLENGTLEHDTPDEDNTLEVKGVRSAVDRVADGIEFGLDKIGDGILFPIDKTIDLYHYLFAIKNRRRDGSSK